MCVLALPLKLKGGVKSLERRIDDVHICPDAVIHRPSLAWLLGLGVSGLFFRARPLPWEPFQWIGNKSLVQELRAIVLYYTIHGLNKGATRAPP